MPRTAEWHGGAQGGAKELGWCEGVQSAATGCTVDILHYYDQVFGHASRAGPGTKAFNLLSTRHAGH
jgi:hypothetical protein